jgi:hypothetical protein
MLERRLEPRAKSVFRSAYVQTKAGLQFVTLRNISESGVCLDSCPGVAEGDEIDFCIDSTGLRKGTVRWVGDGLCGIVLHSGELPDPAHQDRRARSVRLPLSVGVQLFVKGRAEQATLRNISIRGACINGRNELTPGQLVSLSICGFHFELATVRWVKQGLFGLRFADPIYPGLFRELVAKVQQVPVVGPSQPHVLAASRWRPSKAIALKINKSELCSPLHSGVVYDNWPAPPCGGKL